MESERLRNSLLSAISHDLRTPLTSIVGFASVLSDRYEPPNAADDSTKELISAIHEEALRMSGLVTNLLDMARLEAGAIRLNRQWSMLEEVVGAALAACRRTLEGHPVKVSVPPELPLVKLDAVLMERLFANLLENAAKYTPLGTPLVISAVVEPEADQKFIRVCVEDSGPGVPPGMEHRLFDKFTRGEKESAKPGIGLGLAICRAIVEAHGGRIGVENGVDAEGRVTGARFWFTLPANESPPLEAPPDEDAETRNAATSDRP
jgi:two-component system sensor histidine kinase KdpD